MSEGGKSPLARNGREGKACLAVRRCLLSGGGAQVKEGKDMSGWNVVPFQHILHHSRHRTLRSNILIY